MRAYWVSCETGRASVVETDGSDDDLRRLCGCERVATSWVRVGGLLFNVAMGDDAMLADGPGLTAIDMDASQAIHGSIVFFGVRQRDSGLASLDDARLGILMARTTTVVVIDP